jgi:hypothetical protein
MQHSGNFQDILTGYLAETGTTSFYKSANLLVQLFNEKKNYCLARPLHFQPVHRIRLETNKGFIFIYGSECFPFVIISGQISKYSKLCSQVYKENTPPPPAPSQEEGRLISGGNYEKGEKKKGEEKKVENVKEKGMKTKDKGKLKIEG